jgi:hypothetical protein
MAWSFRRSINLGPFRINLSKKGAGFSVGGRGFRAGRDSQGRDYTQVSIPGTGIYNRQYYSSGSLTKPQQQSSPPATPSQAAQPVPGVPQTQAQLSPSTKYLLVLTGVGGLVWVLMRLFLR